MRAEGVERYIGMATPSLRELRDTGSLLGRLVPFMGRTFLSRAYRELLEMSQLATDSRLDWTIARFARPTDGARTGSIRAGYLSRDKIRASITRADIPPSCSPGPATRASTAPHRPSATDGAAAPPARTRLSLSMPRSDVAPRRVVRAACAVAPMTAATPMTAVASRGIATVENRYLDGARALPRIARARARP
jgi:hypothetical protein